MTEQEMQVLDFRHLATKEMKRERHAEKERERKHKSGENKLTRDEYTKLSIERKEQAKKLRENGLPWKEVGNILGITGNAARKLVSRQ